LETYRWLPYLKPEGRIIANLQQINPPSVFRGEMKYPEGLLEKLKVIDSRTIAFDALKEAVALGDSRVATVLLVGALSRRLYFQESIWLKKVQELVPKKAVEINLRAFQRGQQMGNGPAL